MESQSSALDRPLDTGHLRFLLSIPITPYPAAYTYGYRAGSTFIKISRLISDGVHAPGRTRLIRSNQGRKIDRQPVLSMAVDGTNRNTGTGRGFLQVGHPAGGGSPVTC